ncbi:MAG: histidinol-phosphate transaminase [Gemmatimonadota bacterium]
MDRRNFLRAGALAGAAATLPRPAAGAGIPLAPWRGAGTAEDPLRLNANENPLGISPRAREAARDAFTVANRYTDHWARPFHKQLARHLGVIPDQLFLGNGSTEVLQMAVQALCGDGARIVTADPTFEALDSRYAHDLTLMRDEAARAPGPVIVYLCNPNNPTGTLTPLDEISAWIREADPKVFFVIDEAYFELVEAPGHASFLSWTRDYPNLLVVRTFSKIYGMAGLRMGYGIAHPETVARIVPWMANNNTNQIAIAAAAASLDDQEHVTRSLETNRASRTLVLDTLEELGFQALPSHTNFVMHEIGMNVGAYQRLFREAGIAVGRAFPPMLQHNRVSLGTPQEMARWAERLRELRRQGRV